MSQKKVSLRDLAYELKVSVSTVSRALKDHPDISKELKARIFDYAKKMNYAGIGTSQEKKSSATKTIGVIVPNMEKYFYASTITGIESYAKNKGYFIIIANSNESYANEIECVNNLIKLNVEGLIVCLSQETIDSSHFDKAWMKNIPVVFFDRVCRTNEFSSVVADNTDAAQAITNHLINCGAKKIAHIAGPEKLSITKERIAGYFKALEENKLKFNDEYLEYCNLSPEDSARAVNRLLKVANVPDAIFCVNDTVAYVAMKEIKRRGLKIPEDIALTGFNNEFHSTIVEPSLTTISHPTIELGEETARLLIRQLKSEHPHAPRQIVMKTKLVVRESSIKNK